MAVTQVRGVQVKDDDITSDDIADAAVRGATSNVGTQREIATGTVSTPDLRDDAVSPAKLDDTGNFTMGTLAIGNGSAATPSLSFTGDVNTGIYHPGADELGLSTNGTQRFIINANGEIAIGGAPVTSAILALNSTTKAFLPPRMTTTERNAISGPVAGMVIYNTTTSTLNIYTTSWGELTVTETDPLSIHRNGDNSPTANIDWNTFQILNLVMHKLSSDPGSPVEGQIWYNTTDKQAKMYNGTATVILG